MNARSSSARKSPGLTSSQETFAALQADVRGFNELSKLLREAVGINLPENSKNVCLMASRLNSVLRNLELQTYSEYLQHLKTNGEQVFQEFVEAMTTNTTHFFREAKHFDILSKKISELLTHKRTKGNQELRIWCAASSTGQEAYTLAMLLRETIPDFNQWKIHFLATDIDRMVLEKAAQGIYTEAETLGIPPLMREAYFTQLAQKGGTLFRANPELTSMVRFAQFNLLSEKYPFQHRFDVIFCRNVLIYFDPETSHEVVRKLVAALGPQGLLFLGHSESGAMKTQSVKQIAAAAYQKSDTKEGRL